MTSLVALVGGKHGCTTIQKPVWPSHFSNLNYLIQLIISFTIDPSQPVILFLLLMGVSGLWQVCLPCKDHTSLLLNWVLDSRTSCAIHNFDGALSFRRIPFKQEWPSRCCDWNRYQVLNTTHISPWIIPQFFFISVWFSQCQRVVAVTHPQAGTHPELRIIFYRLVRFLQAAVIPVFVFDGADRPSTKRGMKVQKQPHWLAAPTQELIKAFGFYWYTVRDETNCPSIRATELTQHYK